MKKYFKDIIIFIILFYFFIFSISNNLYIRDRVYYSFTLWLYKIVPTILPTFIIVELLFSSRIIVLLKKFLPIDPLFIVSIISGSPTNAYILNKNHEDITDMLSITKFTGFIFTYTSLVSIFDIKISVILIIINIMINFILYCFIKPKISYSYKSNGNIIYVFLSSIRNCMVTLINILGLVIVFNIIPISMIHNSFFKGLLYSLFEATSSFDYLSYCPLSYHVKLLFTIITLSTCGCCISMQIKSIISDTSFNYKRYLFIRLIHLCLFLIIGLIIL